MFSAIFNVSESDRLMRRLPVEHPDRLEEHRKFSIKYVLPY